MAGRELAIGDTLGGFQLEKELGRGGMGVVYKAHELSLNRKVALKVLAQRLTAEPEFVERFRREAQIVAQLVHPNIVGILAYGEQDDLHYYAMEYVQGRDLTQWLGHGRQMPLGESLGIARQVASALEEAHRHGVVHRDLKPQNIMLDDLGRAKVTDFGLARFETSDVKLTQTGMFLGTPEYASPEQASGRPLDIRSDIYAFGAVLYRIFSGRAPVTGDTPLAVMAKIVTEAPEPLAKVNPNLPAPIVELVGKMMARDPKDRFQTPTQVLEAIEACIRTIERGAAPTFAGSQPTVAVAAEDAPTTPPAPPAPTRVPAPARPAPVAPPPPARRSLLPLVLAGLALVAVLGLAGLFWAGRALWNRGVPAGAPVDSASRALEPAQPVETAGEGAAAGDGQALVPEPGGTGADAAGSNGPAPAPSGVAGTDAASAVPAAPASFAAPRPAAGRPAAGASGVSGAAPAGSASTAAAVATSSSATSAAAAPAAPPAALPEVPTVYVAVSGDPQLAAAARQVVEAAVVSAGLGLTPTQGRRDLTLLVEVQPTGSRQLRFAGRSQEQVLASFSIQGVDEETGRTVVGPTSGDFEYAGTRMKLRLTEALEPAASETTSALADYWKDKRGR